MIRLRIEHGGDPLDAKLDANLSSAANVAPPSLPGGSMIEGGGTLESEDVGPVQKQKDNLDRESLELRIDRLLAARAACTPEVAHVCTPSLSLDLARSPLSRTLSLHITRAG